MEYWNQNEQANKIWDTLYNLIKQYEKHRNDKDKTIKKLIIELIKEHTKYYVQISGTIFPELITENKNIIKIMNNINKETKKNAISKMQSTISQCVRK